VAYGLAKKKTKKYFKAAIAVIIMTICQRIQVETTRTKMAKKRNHCGTFTQLFIFICSVAD